MKMFRCYNCPNEKDIPGRDFLADKPVCPKCGLDGTPGKPHADLVVQRRALHFDPPHPVVKGRGLNAPACGKPYAGNIAMTGDPDVVNCPVCLASAAWKKAKEAKDSGPDDVDLPEDFAVQVDLAGGQLVKAGE